MTMPTKALLSIVQGRLSTLVGDRYQHFPIHSWREEFSIASSLGFEGIEWIVSDFSNPIFDKQSLEEVARLSRKYNLSITSIALDVLMYHPIHELARGDVEWLFEQLTHVSAHVDVGRVNIPIEENSGIRTEKQRDKVISILRSIRDNHGNNLPDLSIETDLSAENVCHLLLMSGLEHIGVLLDLGNIAANGFSPQEYYDICPERIIGLHVKDRSKGFGKSIPLGVGDADLEYAMRNVARLPNLLDITLQCYRSKQNYVTDAASALETVVRLLERGA